MHYLLHKEDRCIFDRLWVEKIMGFESERKYKQTDFVAVGSYLELQLGQIPLLPVAQISRAAMKVRFSSMTIMRTYCSSSLCN